MTELLLAASPLIEEVSELTEILKVGGGYAVAAIFILVWMFERRERKQLQKTVVSLAVAAERARSATAHAIQGFKSLLESIQSIVNRCVVKGMEHE